MSTRSPPKRSASNSTLVRDLYGALAEEMRLERCLDLLAPVFGSHITGIRAEDTDAHRALFEVRGALTPEDIVSLGREYAERWAGQNLWMERSIDGYLAQGFQYSEAAISDAELLASPYYRNYLKRVDVRHGLGICLWSNQQKKFVVASFNRRASVGPMGPKEISLARELQPHLANLYGIYRRFEQTDLASRSLRSSFDRLPVGILLLDANGTLLECNAKADQLLCAGTSLVRKAEGGLGARIGSVNLRLQATLKRIIAADSPSAPEVFFIPGVESSVHDGLIAHLCTLPEVASGTLAARGRVLCFLYEAGGVHVDESATLRLKCAIGLTTMEARVAILLREHNDPECVASKLGVAISTVRSHVKSLFLKTGTSRQSELVLLVERIVSMSPYTWPR